MSKFSAEHKLSAEQIGVSVFSYYLLRAVNACLRIGDANNLPSGRGKRGEYFIGELLVQQENAGLLD